MYQNDFSKSVYKTEDIQSKIKIGIVTNCGKLNVRETPNVDSKVICIVDSDSELVIDENSSTNDFYKICTDSGVDGFCMKKYISVCQ